MKYRVIDTQAIARQRFRESLCQSTCDTSGDCNGGGGGRGPTGPTGTDGPTGPTGATGATGATGSFDVNAWLLDGNTVGSEKFIGTIDNFNFPIRTNNTVRGLVDNGGLWAIGSSSTTAGARLAITATGTTSATYAIRTFNSTPTEIFSVRDDGYIFAGDSAGNLTIGAGSGYHTGNFSNTFIGVNIGLTAGTNGGNTAVGHIAMRDLTDAQNSCAFGKASLMSMTTGGVALGENNAFGTSALTALTTGYRNCAFGESSCVSAVVSVYNSAFGARTLYSATGSYNSAFGGLALGKITGNTGDENSAFGYASMNLLQGGSQNTACGAQSGFNITSGSRNVFLGYDAGFNSTTASDQLIIHNRDAGSIANELTKSLIYGIFASTTASQIFRVNANLGILTGTFGTNADGVIGIANGTVPSTSPANMIQIFSADTDDATTSLGMRAEQTVAVESVVSDATLKITYNGTVYKICLKT